MSRNGSGTYNLPAGNPVVTGTTISSTWANNTLNDIASALTGSIASDGQTTPTGNLPMGGYIHTGVGNATARTNYASAAQVEDGTLNYLTSVSGTNTITATAPVSMSAYVAGQTFRFIAAGANTGAVTLNLNAIGAKSLVRTDGSALVSGDIASGAAVQVFYDGTNFQLLNDANGQSETVTTLTATTKVVTPQVGSSSGSFTIQSANTTAITVDSSQNVGIGTSSPSFKLDVSGGARVTGNLGVGGSGTTTVSSGVAVNNANGTYPGYEIQTNGTTQFYINATNGASYISSVSTNPMIFSTNGSERMRIDSSGNVGIGGSSTGARLQTIGGGISVQGNSNPSSGSGVELVYLSGTTGLIQAYDRTNSAYKQMVMDGNPVVFQSNGTERMRIDSSGNVLVGTTSSGGVGFTVASDAAGRILTSNVSAIPFDVYFFKNNGTTVGKITINTSSTAYTTTSDYRLKENVVDLSNALETVAQLKPRKFSWKATREETSGFIAHELQAVVPDCVTGEKDAVDADGNPVYQGIDTSFLVATLTAALQELSAKVTALEAQLTK